MFEAMIKTNMQVLEEAFLKKAIQIFGAEIVAHNEDIFSGQLKILACSKCCLQFSKRLKTVGLIHSR